MKWHIANILALISVPVVPTLAVKLGYLSDKDNQSAAKLLVLLILINLITRILADIEAGEASILWYILLVGFGSFFAFYGITGELP